MLYGLAAAILWGLGDLLAKGVVDRLGPRSALIRIQGGAFAMTLAVVAASGVRLALPVGGVGFLALTAAANAASVGLLYLALLRGPATLAVPLSTCSGAVALILALGAGTARASGAVLVLLFAVTAAAMAVTVGPGRRRSWRSSSAALASAIAGGVATWSAGRWIASPETAAAGALLNMGLLCLLGVIAPRRMTQPVQEPPAILVTGAALAAAGGYAAFLSGVMHDRLDETGVLSTLSGAVAAAGAAIVLRERPGILRGVGLAAIAILVPILSWIT